MDKESCTCHNCMEYKKGICFGQLDDICRDYKHSPVVPEETIKSWPTSCSGAYGYNYY